jgi:hypothetical protein
LAIIWVYVTATPSAPVDVLNEVMAGGTVTAILPAESVVVIATELEKVDSGVSVMVLVMVDRPACETGRLFSWIERDVPGGGGPEGPPPDGGGRDVRDGDGRALWLWLELVEDLLAELDEVVVLSTACSADVEDDIVVAEAEGASPTGGASATWVVSSGKGPILILLTLVADDVELDSVEGAIVEDLGTEEEDEIKDRIDELGV